MYKVSVADYFSGAHNLREYEGKCEELHGHNWKVEVMATADTLNKTGMVVDFKILKDALKEILGLLDHKHLNEVDYFKKVNPTSENIAKFIFDQLTDAAGSIVQSVSVWETENSRATYKR